MGSLFRSMLVLKLVLLLLAPPQLEASTTLSREEVRRVLIQYMENVRLRQESGEDVDLERVRQQVKRLVLQYRLDREKATQSIADAPYPGLVLTLLLEPDTYEQIYDEEYQKQHQIHVGDMNPEVIFDDFLGMVVNGQIDDSLPRDIRKAGGKIGKCLAKKALRAKGESCPLDLSEQIDEPNFFSQLWAKLDCSLGSLTMGDCRARRIIFNSAKPQLLAAINDPELNLRGILDEAFADAFPSQFRQEFIAQMSRDLSDFPTTVNAKFDAQKGELWSDRVALVESDDPDEPTRLTLATAAAGLRADAGAAAILAGSEDPSARSMAAAMLYAAANRLLVLTGGEIPRWQEVRRDGKKVRELVPAQDPKGVLGVPVAKAPPHFEMQRFGGWGLQREAVEAGGENEKDQVSFRFSPWDWATYQPEANVNPSPFRLFPSQFVLGRNGIPSIEEGDQPVERMSDLAALVRGVVDFLRVTRHDGSLGRHFGTMDEMGSLFEPDSPILFPQDGRILGLGMLAGVMKNLATEGKGHIEEVNYGIRVLFHELVDFDARRPNMASVSSVSRLLTAASDLLDVLKGDPAIPAEFKELETALAEAGQAGSFALGAHGQGPDGGFFEVMNQPMQQGRTLRSQIAGLRAMVRIRHAVGIPALLTLVEPGWKFLDRFWEGNELVRLVEGGPQIERLSPALALEILNLWQECQGNIRETLANAVRWDIWETRMERLRERVEAELPEIRGASF